MSGSGAGINSYLYGGADGRAISVSEGGNVYVQSGVDKIKNIGRFVLRTAAATRLPDLPAAWVSISNKEGNGTVWIGGYGDDAPQVNLGRPLYEGDTATMNCKNLNQYSIIPTNDGDEILVIASLTGPDVTITPNNPAALDLTPPTILSNTPTAGATDISRDTQIVITASETLDDATVDSTTVTLVTTIGSTPVAATTTLDSADPAKIVIIPSAILDASTSYTVTVTTGVKDPTGNALVAPHSFAFTTAAGMPGVETTPPTVVSHTPTQNQTGVSITVAPSILFSEAMLLSSITSTSVQIKYNSNNQVVPGTSYSLSGDLKTLNITSPTLENSTVYRIDILGGTGGVTDLAGNVLATTYSITFTTVAAALTTIYSVGGNDSDDLYSGHYTEEAEHIGTGSALIGKKPKTLKPIIVRSSSPPGTCYVLWQRKSGSSWVTFKTLYSIAASSLPNSTLSTWPATTIDMSTNTDAFALDDKITIKYDGGGSSSTKVKVRTSNIDAFDGTKTYITKYNGSYTSVTGHDVAMEIIVG